jgi:hypothetical protein
MPITVEHIYNFKVVYPSFRTPSPLQTAEQSKPPNLVQYDHQLPRHLNIGEHYIRLGYTDAKKNVTRDGDALFKGELVIALRALGGIFHYLCYSGTEIAEIDSSRCTGELVINWAGSFLQGISLRFFAP